MKSILYVIFSCFFALLLQCKNAAPNENVSKKAEITEEPAGWPWRGITIVSHVDRDKVTETSIQNMAEKGINLIRLRLSVRKFARIEKLSAQKSTENTFVWAEKIIGWAEENNIKILISTTDFPINPKIEYNQTDKEFWNSETDLAECLKHIESTVKRFDGFNNVIAYEFIAEPVVRKGNKSERPSNWNTFFERIVKTIRKTSNKYILYTPGPWGGPGGYADMGEKWEDDRIIYNFHFYLPHRYTHQGIGKNQDQYEYPGRVRLKNWDKVELEKAVHVATDWGRKNNANYFFAGEFSVVRWAEGRDQYLEDVLSIFEDNDIAWAYFSFNGWQGWDYEMEPESNDTNSRLLKKEHQNSATEILGNFWGKNLKKNE